MLPAFGIMLALLMVYAGFEATSIMRGDLYGMGPLVLAIFIVAVYRLGRSALRGMPHLSIGAAAAIAAASGTLGVAAILALATGAGLLCFRSRKAGAIVLGLLVGLIAVVHLVRWSPPSFVALTSLAAATQPMVLVDLAVFFLGVGALTFGGPTPLKYCQRATSCVPPASGRGGD